VAKKDPRIDAYIAKAQPFARPILKHIRAVVHSACPDVVETVKWSMPHFDYHGSIMCGMGSFKAHVVFGFWRGAQLLGDKSRNDEAMGDLGRVTCMEDLPSKAKLTALIKAAMKLNEAGVKRVARKQGPPKKALPVPKDLALALGRDAKAKATFDGFSPSNKREYIEWITGAKAAATRERRLATALEWLAEGKTRNWKYQ
jgi:hypothetical protein